MRFDKETIICVVGATKNKEKYGYKVFHNLLSRGFKVFPVNPKYDEIEGVRCYGSLEDIKNDKGDVGLVVIVTPPKITESIVKKCNELSIKQVWMQPGAENDDAIRYCEDRGIDCVYNACIMMTE